MGEEEREGGGGSGEGEKEGGGGSGEGESVKVGMGKPRGKCTFSSTVVNFVMLHDGLVKFTT